MLVSFAHGKRAQTEDTSKYRYTAVSGVVLASIVLALVRFDAHHYWQDLVISQNEAPTEQLSEHSAMLHVIRAELANGIHGLHNTGKADYAGRQSCWFDPTDGQSVPDATAGQICRKDASHTHRPELLYCRTKISTSVCSAVVRKLASTSSPGTEFDGELAMNILLSVVELLPFWYCSRRSARIAERQPCQPYHRHQLVPSSDRRG